MVSMSTTGSEVSFLSFFGSDVVGRGIFGSCFFPFFDCWGASEGVVTFGLGAFGIGFDFVFDFDFDFNCGFFCAGSLTSAGQAGQYFMFWSCLRFSPHLGHTPAPIATDSGDK